MPSTLLLPPCPNAVPASLTPCIAGDIWTSHLVSRWSQWHGNGGGAGAGRQAAPSGGRRVVD